MNQSKRERIEARAYEIWEREGRPPNKEAEHWRRAEQEVAREEASQQMGGRSESTPAPDVDTRPAPPLAAAPPLGDADTRAGGPPEDSAQKRTLKKPTRSRRKPADRQQG
jgi:hypothetical protein